MNAHGSYKYKIGLYCNRKTTFVFSSSSTAKHWCLFFAVVGFVETLKEKWKN